MCMYKKDVYYAWIYDIFYITSSGCAIIQFTKERRLDKSFTSFVGNIRSQILTDVIPRQYEPTGVIYGWRPDEIHPCDVMVSQKFTDVECVLTIHVFYEGRNN